MFGIIGSGSWATALAKILTDNNQQINWLVRTEAMADFISKQKHNPNYLTTAVFEPTLLNLDTNVSKIVSASDYIIIATPSAYVADTLKSLSFGTTLTTVPSFKVLLIALKGPVTTSSPSASPSFISM